MPPWARRILCKSPLLESRSNPVVPLSSRPMCIAQLEAPSSGTRLFGSCESIVVMMFWGFHSASMGDSGVPTSGESHASAESKRSVASVICPLRWSHPSGKIYCCKERDESELGELRSCLGKRKLRGLGTLRRLVACSRVTCVKLRQPRCVGREANNTNARRMANLATGHVQ